MYLKNINNFNITVGSIQVKANTVTRDCIEVPIDDLDSTDGCHDNISPSVRETLDTLVEANEVTINNVDFDGDSCFSSQDRSDPFSDDDDDNDEETTSTNGGGGTTPTSHSTNTSISSTTSRSGDEISYGKALSCDCIAILVLLFFCFAKNIAA